jgi:hypothetical protein
MRYVQYKYEIMNGRWSSRTLDDIDRRNERRTTKGDQIIYINYLKAEQANTSIKALCGICRFA